MPEELPLVPFQFKSGQEPLHTGGCPIGPKLCDYWKWSNSDLLSNTLRGVLAEYLVATALELDDKPREEWAECDIVMRLQEDRSKKCCLYSILGTASFLPDRLRYRPEKVEMERQNGKIDDAGHTATGCRRLRVLPAEAPMSENDRPTRRRSVGLLRPIYRLPRPRVREPAQDRTPPAPRVGRVSRELRRAQCRHPACERPGTRGVKNVNGLPRPEAALAGRRDRQARWAEAGCISGTRPRRRSICYSSSTKSDREDPSPRQTRILSKLIREELT